jgi:NAD(P)-dependent dehydrogenase (short-subunit alcohol dehydrogenase family)
VTPTLSPDATYLLVGGLGGIGSSIARRLVALGARHLVFISRTAASPSKVQANVVRELENAGTQVVLKSCDVANRVELVAVLASLPPIRGVIQAAMVLRVCPLFELIYFLSHFQLKPYVGLHL